MQYMDAIFDHPHLHYNHKKHMIIYIYMYHARSHNNYYNNSIDNYIYVIYKIYTGILQPCMLSRKTAFH